jgi:hypothetical protein
MLVLGASALNPDGPLLSSFWGRSAGEISLWKEIEESERIARIKVYKYTGAASRLSGSQNAASSFSLASGKKGDPNPQDIVTDGKSFWVVDGSALKVRQRRRNLSLS